jgi:hypothetical protein
MDSAGCLKRTNKTDCAISGKICNSETGSCLELDLQNGVTPLSAELCATFESIGITSNYSGDQNDNSYVEVQYRKSGQSWKEGNPLSRIKENRYAGSLFFLSPNTEYEVMLVYHDNEGVVGNALKSIITTRSEIFSSGSGSTYHVSISGSDSNSGTESKPFRTMQ